MWRIPVVNRSTGMITCQVTDVMSSYKDVVCILEKFEATEGWEKVGSDLNQGVWWLTRREWHSESWFELVFREATDWDKRSVRGFRQIAAGEEWRDTPRVGLSWCSGKRQTEITSVRGFRQIAAGEEWRHTLPPLSCLFSLSHLCRCPGFGWHRVNFPPSSCCGLDLVEKACW